jgi:acyl-CoA reductase-like NAD-dependent aldehyde dehydrogenase
VRHKLWIGGQWVDSTATREILSPFDSRKVAEVAQASAAQVELALAEAERAFRAYRRFSAYTRSRLLAAMAQGIAARRKDFVDSIVHEAGKPRTMADAEVSRAVMTFTLASEEVKRFGGEVLPVDLDAAARAYSPAVTRWEPRGPVLAIAPFNFPLNLVAHKVAPALAAGVSVLLKPSPQAPGAASLLGEVFGHAAREVSDARESIPLSLLQIVNGSNEVISPAVGDPRIATLSFTGSDKVGWMLQRAANRKKVCLELGGNAAVIVHSDADLARVAARCAYGAFAYAGQICISVQRILVHRDVATRFQEELLREIEKLKVGDPDRPDTVVGPLIDASNAGRVMQWIDEARQGEARVLCGGTRTGNVVAPTLIADARADARVSCEEVFGPIATLAVYGELGEAISTVNRSRYGLQAGIFSDSARVISEVCDELEVGGILVNEIPTFRADNMPYGGIKDSGLGREGLRYAMEEFSERKVVVSWKG